MKRATQSVVSIPSMKLDQCLLKPCEDELISGLMITQLLILRKILWENSRREYEQRSVMRSAYSNLFLLMYVGRYKSSVGLQKTHYLFIF